MVANHAGSEQTKFNIVLDTTTKCVVPFKVITEQAKYTLRHNHDDVNTLCRNLHRFLFASCFYSAAKRQMLKGIFLRP